MHERAEVKNVADGIAEAESQDHPRCRRDRGGDHHRPVIGPVYSQQLQEYDEEDIADRRQRPDEDLGAPLIPGERADQMSGCAEREQTDKYELETFYDLAPLPSNRLAKFCSDPPQPSSPSRDLKTSGAASP